MIEVTFFVIVWCICGLMGWYIVVRMHGGKPDSYDMAMVGTCMVLGLLILYPAIWTTRHHRKPL